MGRVMKKVKEFRYITGLGNPGKQYEKTRHNTGFMFIDYLLDGFDKYDIRKKSLKHGEVIEVKDRFVFTKPQKFMNRSGEAAREMVKWYDVDVKKNLLLVHDDLDIPFGKYKLQFAKSPRDHKGVVSVERHLGTTHFHRLRIGSDNRGDKNIDGNKYVLKRYTEEELLTLREVFDDAIKN